MSSTSSESGKVLILTVGLPRSGKSTYAKSQGFPIVNPDSIRLALHGKPFIGLAELFVWAIARTMVRALFLAGHDCVILDATNTTRKRRDEWKSEQWTRRYRIFKRQTPTGRDECIARAKASCHDAEHEAGLIEAINRMDEAWEDVEENEWN